MKKIICFLIILILSIVIVINLNKENNFINEKDGVIFALSLDGKNISSFPQGRNYNVEIDCTNATGIWLPESWQLSLKNIEGDIICNMDFKTRTDAHKLTSIVENETTLYRGNNNEEAGYRYVGANPNNYIWFNNELWRIIGSVPTKDNNGIIKNMVKIIRNESIGELSYDAKDTYSNFLSLWGDNTLYDLLNTYYYSSVSENHDGNGSVGCYIYKNKMKGNCNYKNIGILSTSYYGKMVKNVYWNIGEVNRITTTKQSFSSEILNQNVSGYIGLISVSDYGYAFSSTHHNLNMSDLYNYDINNWKYNNNNWIYNNGTEWTISKLGGNAGVRVNFIEITGEISSGSYDDSASVRPVVYLDSNVYVVSGNGEITNPYQISL